MDRDEWDRWRNQWKDNEGYLQRQFPPSSSRLLSESIRRDRGLAEWEARQAELARQEIADLSMALGLRSP